MVKKYYNNKIVDHFSQIEDRTKHALDLFNWQLERFYHRINSLPMNDRLYVSPIIVDRVIDAIYSLNVLDFRFSKALSEESFDYHVEVEKASRRIQRFVTNYFNYLSTHADRLAKNKKMNFERVLIVVDFCNQHGMTYYVSRSLSAHLLKTKLIAI